MKYNDVQIVTRDRSSSYSSAIDEACPDASQIADRFHLLMNLSDALDRYFKSISGTINRLIKSKNSELLSINETETKNILAAEFQINDIRIDPRLDRFNKVKELKANEVPVLRISKDLGMSRKTVRSYFVQESLSPRSHPKFTNIELFTNHIVARLNVSGYKLKDIFEEICVLGFNGSRSQALYNINIITENYKINTPGFLQFQNTRIQYIKPLNTRKLAKYIGLPFIDMNDTQERNYLD